MVQDSKAKSGANYQQKVWRSVRQIPKGKVATYGMIAGSVGIDPRMAGWPHTELTSSRGLGPRVGGAFVRGKALHARAVGNALHKNTDSSVPCHRVVDRNGRLAPNFAGPQLPGAIATGWRAFDGWREQKRRLEAEGVIFRDEMHVNLEESLWQV